MANSLIDFSVVQPDAAGSFLSGFQRSQSLAQQQAAQQQQNQLAALQLRAAQRGEEQALAEQEAYKGAATLGDVQQRLMQAGLGKQSLALQKQVQEQRAAQIQQAKAAHDFVQSQLNGVIANPTRQAAEAAIARAEAMGADVSQERARLAGVPDNEIAKWALIESGKAKEALEQSIIQLPGGGTAIEPKYAIPGAQTSAAATSAAPIAAPAMPAGIPGQTLPTRAAGVNALALPAPGVAAMAQGAVATPTGGRYFPPAMTPQQQAAEARAQQQLGMERERLELSKESELRKRAEVPSETRKELTSIDQQRSIIDGALKAVKETPGAFSFARGAAAAALPFGESVVGRLETPEQTQARAYVFNNVSRVINERAGAAQSAQEMQRLRSFLPADTDNAEQITNKLKGFQTYLQDLEKGTIKAAPPAAKKALEETRKPQLSARDQQALEWANANLGDPRAAQIKQRLGVQ